MKYVFFFLVSAFVIGCNAIDKPMSADKEKAIKDTANFTSIQWLDSIHQQVGKIDEGQVLEITWHFRNAGTKPLIIANVRPGCGCTGATGPEEPVAPGKEGTILAKFDSKGITGSQTKEVFVTSNTKNPGNMAEQELKFSLEVTPKN